MYQPISLILVILLNGVLVANAASDIPSGQTSSRPSGLSTTSVSVTRNVTQSTVASTRIVSSSALSDRGNSSSSLASTRMSTSIATSISRHSTSNTTSSAVGGTLPSTTRTDSSAGPSLSFAASSRVSSASSTVKPTASTSTSISTTRSSTIPSTSPTPKIVSSPLLLAIVNAHAWQQYKYQATACLTSPSIYSDCSEWYRGYGIIRTASLSYDMHPADYWPISYQYTRVTFYGFNRANYTLIGPTLRNSSAALMYSSCLANSTCNQTMAAYSTSVIKSTLENHVGATFNAVLNAIPANGSMTYQPYPYSNQANAMDIFTSATTFGSEIYGVHDLFTFSAANRTLTLARLQGLQKLAVYLEGGPSIYESMINRLAFYAWDPYDDTIIDPSIPQGSKRGFMRGQPSTHPPHPPPIPGQPSIYSPRRPPLPPVEYLDKYSDLRAVSTMRGRDRRVLRTMTMDKYLPTLGFDLAPMLQARDCSNADNVQRYIGELNSIVSGSCALLSIKDSIFDIGKVADNFGKVANNAKLLKEWMPVLQTFGNVQADLLSIVLTATSSLCTLAGTTSPCFPNAAVYLNVLDQGETVYTLIKDLVKVGAAGPLGPAAALYIGADIACAGIPMALDAYQNAAKCCASNCNSVACYAASNACAIQGLHC